LKKGASVPGLVFAALGVPFAGIGLWLGVQRLAIVLSWPEAPAVVSESRVETRGASHAARIRVRFETPKGVVETDAEHDHRYGRHATIAEAVERYTTGTHVAVRYDPEDAKKARLEAGFNLETFGLCLVLLAAAASFGGVGLLALRSGRSQTAADEVRLVGGFVLAIGAVFVVSGLAMLPGALAQRRWPQVTARVDRADVYARSDSSPRKGRSATTWYVVRVYLAYEQDGRGYVSPMDEASHREEAMAQRIAGDMVRGAPRTIRVDPRHPNRIDRIDSWPLALPSVFVGVGLLLCGIVRLLLRRYAR